MSETPSPTVDSAGVTRTATGEIAAPLTSSTSSTTPTTPPAESPASTSQTPGSSFLTDDKSTAKDAPAAPVDKDGKPVVGEGAPEAYADFTLPEGYELKDELKGEVTGMFKNWNLTQDQAQQAIDFYTQHTKEAMDAPYQLFLETRKGWRADIAADPVIGPKQAAVKAEIGRAIQSLGDSKMIADFRQALDLTGIGDHPAFVRAFYAFSQRINEGTPVSGRGPSPLGQIDPARGDAKPSAAQAMYPNLPTSQRG